MGNCCGTNLTSPLVPASKSDYASPPLVTVSRCDYAKSEEQILNELRVACESYETARQLIVSEMEDCDRLMRLALSEVEAADEDEVLFSARGELVTASRSSLLRTEGTYFYGLLNRGSWLTDAIGAHSIDDDSAVLKLVMASLLDKRAFDIHVRELDACTREYLNTRLDYYQAPALLYDKIRTNSSIKVVHNDIISQVSLSKTNYKMYRGAIWDPAIRRYSATVNASCTMAILIGFAPAKLYDISKHNFTSCGWYLYLAYGSLHAQDGVRRKAYSRGCKVGDVITCIYDASSREISFERNGASLGVAYSSIIGEDIAPAVELLDYGDSITLSAC